jgi:hypothetical protein
MYSVVCRARAVMPAYERQRELPADSAFPSKGDTHISGNGRNKYRHVAVQLGQSAVQRRQLTVVVPGELSKVGIGHLPVANHAAHLHISERHTVGPELVAVRALDCADHIARGSRYKPRPQQETNNAALSERARRERRIDR